MSSSDRYESSLPSNPRPVEMSSPWDTQTTNTVQYSPLNHSDDSSGEKDEAASESQAVIQEDTERTVGIRWSLALPTLAVVLLSAGVATVLLLWLLHYETSHSVLHEGAFLLDEGIKREAGTEGARLMGLTISSTASHTISVTTPILMSLVAFRIGSVFLSATHAAEHGDDRGLPTPLQFGLLADLLGGLSIMSIFRSTRYFVRSGRARIPFCLKEAFFVGLLVFVVAHAVSAMDIWLHTTTSTVTSITNTTLDDPLNYTIAQNVCLPSQGDDTDNFRCGFDPIHIWDGDQEFGKVVASNSSNDVRAITLAQADDLAVLVVPSAPASVSFVSDTFGARASCTSLNQACNFSGIGWQQTPNCTEYPFFPPYLQNLSDPTGTSPGQGAAYLMTSTISGQIPVLPDPQTAGLPLGDDQDLLLNPAWVMVQFVWESYGVNSPYVNLPNGAVSALGPLTYATLLANCSLSFSNVTLTYSDGNYTVAEETLSDATLAGGLVGPTILGHYASRLFSNVEGIALTSNSTDSVIALLNQELARLALASVASITDLRLPTRGQSTLGTRFLGRYPVVPSLLLVALLYLYALLALVIFVRVALFTRSPTVAMRGARETRVSAIELVQPRLTQTLALAAEMFPAPGSHEEITLRSMQPDALDMYEEGHGQIVERVRIGPHVGRDGTSVFGLWRASDAT